MGVKEFQGVLFDIVEEVIVERGYVLRATYAEAMADAKALVDTVNAMAEASDDDNSTIGRVDESWCFVLVDGALAWSEEEAYP